MNKKELLSRLDAGTLGVLSMLLAEGLTQSEAADWLYTEGYLCYWERDILKGE